MTEPARRYSRVRLQLAAILLFFGCGSQNPTSPDLDSLGDSLTATVQSEHFVFHLTPGDVVAPDRAEAYYDWVSAKLQLAAPTIQYFKYTDRAQMRRLTGQSANGWADPEHLAVHSIFPWEAHESVHVYSAQIGRPSDFFNEGLAVAFSVDPLAGQFEPTYDGTNSVHDWARSHVSDLPPITTIVTTSAFRALNEFEGYQTAGSFLDFLVRTYGASPLRFLFSMGTREDSRQRIESTFESAYGLTVDEADRRWRAFLAN
jgi:hypothetical protein